ncbi:MAG TPA: hypothetical protein VK968_00470 [Roseimicrobium sp.]|nr:hypothetical protein [Roseimicrobium sp.]
MLPSVEAAVLRATELVAVPTKLTIYGADQIPMVVSTVYPATSSPAQ